MAETTQRVLRLLGLLEARTTWQASELSERLGVTERTVRRDVARLRDLGYPVESERGVDGGYQLGAGRQLPPLLLDNDEAVALVACLRMAALSGADNVGEAALRALAKLDRVLPPRVRAVASAVDSATYTLPRTRSAVDLDLLQQLAIAQRDYTLVRFNYRKPTGECSSREAEPARLMTQGEYWYLQAFDRGRKDWRVFRLDRMSKLRSTTWHFEPRKAPPSNFLRDIASRYECVLRVEIEDTLERISEAIPAPYRDELERTTTGCRFLVGAPNWEDLAWHMLQICRDLGKKLILPESPETDAFLNALKHISQQALTLGGVEEFENPARTHQT